MPELPEVESVLRCLRDAPISIIGRTVLKVNILRENVITGDQQQFVSALTGSVFKEIRRHGKYLFFRFTESCGTKSVWMMLHLRMTGKLFLVPENEAQLKHTRLSLLLDKGLALRFDDPRAFGRVQLVQSIAEITGRLGPDGLCLEQTELLQRLAKQKRQLKPLLLDQGFVAGIGNIYADEILFRAKLHPCSRADRLDSQELTLLCTAITEVLQQAVSLKGANIDGVFEAGMFPVAVYGRAKQPCPVCSALIQREKLAGRGTHFCPVCQICKI
ncbi:MAG: DNA-formamidopyrimidine glycosylase [Trichlorobacter sp.]|nr:DNA-formamidopyrimidine glycosylase [Trichlorobacter sp.]